MFGLKGSEQNNLALKSKSGHIQKVGNGVFGYSFTGIQA